MQNKRNIYVDVRQNLSEVLSLVVTKVQIKDKMSTLDFSEITSYIKNNHLAIFGILVAMIGLAYRLYSDLKSNRKKYLFWYKKRKKNEFSYTTRIMFVNKTSQIIDDVSLSTSDKLRVEPINGTTVIDANLVYQTKLGNNLSLSKVSKNGFKIKFDYLDMDDGIIIEVKHKGDSNSQVNLSGSIKGVEEFKHANPRIPFFLRIFSFALFSLLLVVSFRELVVWVALYSFLGYLFLVALFLYFHFYRHRSIFNKINNAGIYKTYNHF